MTKKRKEIIGKHTPAALKNWLAEITSWFDRHPKRNYRSVELPAKFAAALETSDLLTNGAEAVAFLRKVRTTHLPERARLSIIARRPDPILGRGVPDLLLMGVAVREDPAVPPNLDPDQAHEMFGAIAWASHQHSSAPIFPLQA